MSSHEIDNMQKYENYKEQFNRLNKALKNEFYLEAIFIEYAILEDRTESVLRHGGHWDPWMKKRRSKRKPGIEEKLNHLKDLAKVDRILLSRYFSDDLLDQLKAWKNKRNPLIHNLLNQTLGPDDLKDLAEEGYELIKELKNRATNHNRTIERRKAKAGK